MSHSELEFFNSLSGKLEIELTEEPERIGKLDNVRTTPSAKIKSLDLIAEVLTSKNSPQISYNVSGANARINLNSTDNSSNIVNDTSELFESLFNATSRIDNEAQREAIDASIRQMQASIGQKGFIERYQHFIAVASDHLGVFGPLIAQLSALIGS